MSSAGGGSVIRQFRTDYKKRDRHSAAEVNRLGKILNGARGENGVEVRVAPTGLVVRGSGESGEGSGLPDASGADDWQGLYVQSGEWTITDLHATA